MTPLKFRLQQIAPLLLLVILTALTFANSLKGTFIWDDVMLVEQNRYIKDLKYLRRNLFSNFWDVGLSPQESISKGRANVYYRPLVTLSYMVDYQFYGLRPWGYHLTNVLMHLAAVVLAYWVAIRVLAMSRWLAFAAVLVFAVHPTRSEAVTWISGRTDIIMSLFFLATVLLYARFVTNRGRTAITVVGICVCYIAAVLCKETAIALAVVLPALRLWISPNTQPNTQQRYAYVFDIALASITAMFVVVRMVLQSRLGEVQQQIALSLRSRVNMILESVARYAEMIVNPYQPNAQHAAYANPLATPITTLVVGAALIGGSLIALFWLTRRGHKRAAWSLLLSIATIAPVINIVPLRLMVLVAERFVYLPLLGIGLLVGLGIGALSASKLKPILAVTFSLFVATWMGTTYVRASDYTDSLRFWQSTDAASPDNPFVQHTLANLYVQRGNHRRAEALLVAAYRNWHRVVGSDERKLEVIFQLLDVRLLQTTDYDVAFLQHAHNFTRDILAIAAQGQPATKPVALKLGQAELTLRFDRPQAVAALSRLMVNLLTIKGVIESRLGEDALAINTLKTAYRRDPSRLATLLNLALAQARALQFNQARASIVQAQKLDPDSPQVNNFSKLLKNADALAQQLNTTDSPDQKHELLKKIYTLLNAPRRIRPHP